MGYIHPKTGHIMQGYESHQEHCFYENTTKRQMFLIIEQMAGLLKESEQNWVDKAENELTILTINGIK